MSKTSLAIDASQPMESDLGGAADHSPQLAVAKEGARGPLEALEDVAPSSMAFIVSAMPRGALQVVQPARLPRQLSRNYARQFQFEDKAVWEALIHNRVTRAEEAYGAEWPASRIATEFFHPLGVRNVVVVPVGPVIFQGYPAVACLCRGSAMREFSAAEIAALEAAATKVQAQQERRRRARLIEADLDHAPWQHVAATRFGAYDASGALLAPAGGWRFDPKVAASLAAHAKSVIESEGARHGGRILVADESGDRWVFRAGYVESLPALGAGPHAIVTLQPLCEEWSAVRPADVIADVELTRLLPTLDFMRLELGVLPTLHAIAKKAHLSPFHFHRRFTDLIGQTPKHYLLSCQIHGAKKLLVSNNLELMQIASRCGFAHQSHFTSRFKQATGLTPTRWRRSAAHAPAPMGE